MAYPPVPVMPPAPSRADDGNAFSAKADATFAALPNTISGMNALGAYLDDVGAAVDADAIAAAASAVTAELARDAAVGAANFQGPWAIGTTYVVGQSVAYDGGVYIALRTTVGDQPDISPLDWLPLTAGGGSLLGAYVPVNTNYVVPDGYLEVPSTLIFNPATYPDLAAVSPSVSGAVIQSTLQSANPETNGQFGYSVAIAGDYAIVGAYLEDAAPQADSGRAYIYLRSGTSWTLQATLQSANPESSGQFGYSVAIAGDYAIVGAINEDASGIGASGRAYIYVRSGTSWTLQATLQSANPEVNGQFGCSVAIAGDYAIVGARLENASGITDSGRAYIYLRSGTSWTLQATLQAANPESSGQFGHSVAIAGDYAIVGAITEDAAGITDSGRAYIYVRSGTSWTLQATLQSANPEVNGQFGWSVEIAGDYAIVGARLENASGITDSGRAYTVLAFQNQIVLNPLGIANTKTIVRVE